MAKTWTPAQIRKLRESLGDTQEKFAERFGVTYDTAVSWEQPPESVRHRKPMATARKLFDALEKTIGK